MLSVHSLLCAAAPRALLAVTVGWLLTTPLCGAEPADEKVKIEALIRHIENLSGTKFIRNDQEYDARSAAKFLRAKWDSSSAEIKTARDFISKAASVSSTSGKPYRIRFADGKEIPSRDYLLAELKKMEEKDSK